MRKQLEIAPGIDRCKQGIVLDQNRVESGRSRDGMLRSDGKEGQISRQGPGHGRS